MRGARKKKVEVLGNIEIQPWGDRTFLAKDPFGIHLMFAEPVTGFQPPSKRTFLGMEVNNANAQSLEEMIKWLKGFGILRRAAKKYSKLWLKQVFGK